MDQGVTNSFKSHYRRTLVNRYLVAIENREDVNSIKINIREAIDMLTIAWREVISATIANCFRKGMPTTCRIAIKFTGDRRNCCRQSDMDSCSRKL